MKVRHHNNCFMFKGEIAIIFLKVENLLSESLPVLNQPELSPQVPLQTSQTNQVHSCIALFQ